jgi:hypothetical protein
MLVWLTAACGPGSPNDDVVGDGASEASTGEASTTESGDDGPEPACACVELDRICTADASTAMSDCELPSPCGVVDGSAEPATCVLQLLVDGTPARFAYDIDGPGCGFASGETWSGWFYILGPGEGLDNECHEEWCDIAYEQTRDARHYTIAESAYFADCLGKSASVMTGCIFNGLSIGDDVADCR